MPETTINNINLEKHLSLLREMVPDSVDLYACDTAGGLIAADRGNTGEFHGLHSVIDCNRCFEPDCNPGVACLECGASNSKIIPVCNTQEEPVAYLIAVLNDTRASHVEIVSGLITRSFQVVAPCIEKEYSLTAELDAMATELASRYEELNLVYETTDDITDIENEGHTLTSLIRKYIEHLDVDMIALTFPKQERIFSSTNGSEPIPEAYNIINSLGQTYLDRVSKDGDFLLINDFTDLKHEEYQLRIPCKLMACPVLNSQGDATGILVCINHIWHTDFYNSDKNLLHVMARKVAKIVQSNYDAGTGLINQRSFASLVKDATSRSRSRGQFHCVLNIDLDKLKVINESLGRDAGDHIIKCVANLLQDRIRSLDSVSYLGDGRYGVLLEQCSMEQGLQLAESLRKLIGESTFTWNSTSIETSITIGISLIEPHTEHYNDVLEAAEMARNAAKELGQNRVRLYRQSDENIALRKDHLHWVTRIQQALRNDMFIVYCQVISPAKPATRDYHFEILLRLQEEDGSIIPPGKFIPPAEQFNLMPIIDRWVIDRTFSTLSSAGFSRTHGEGIVSINISGQSLADPELTGYIFSNMDKYRIAPDCICFEITETSAIRDINFAQKIFRQLKSRGFRLSLDDFGTGLNSFSYLKDMPVDYLKIDGSFVRTILDDRVTSAMVESINHVGHVMGLETIAEYAENDALVAQLKHIGVDHLQGYAIAEPVALKEYLSGLRTTDSACTG